MTAYLALAYGNTPDLVLIEEPENGLHPGCLQMVVDILRKMSTGESATASARSSLRRIARSCSIT